MKILSLILFCALIVGCTSKAGPFVTNISSDGAGGIVVEKCMVSLQRQMNTMENSDCTNSNIKLSGK
jgi:type IV secretion system protein VirB7